MLDPIMAWQAAVIISLLMGAAFAAFKGAETGLAMSVIASCFFPDWVNYEFFGITLNVRTAVSAIAIAAYALRFPWRIRTPLIPLDYAIAGLVIVHTASDYYHGEGISAALKAYGEWALPYVCGRFALCHNRHPEIIGWAISIMILVMSFGAILEATFQVNFWEMVFGDRGGQFGRDAMRYGFKRAFGNTEHPIFFAMQILMFLPWVIYLWRADERPTTKVVVAATILIGFAGCIATGSRSPMIAFLAIPLVALSVKYSWARWATFAGVIIVGFITIQAPEDYALDVVKKAGDDVHSVQIEGEVVAYSSGMVRFWLWRVYSPALMKGGLLGSGSFATRTFPVEVDGRPTDPKLLHAFRWVDNAYLLNGLRFGWLGMLALVCFLITAIWTGFTLRFNRYWSTMTVTSSAMFIILALMLLTVWFSYDFGFEALWMAGVLAGIRIEQPV